MHPPGRLRMLASAIVVTAATLLSIPMLAATAFAASTGAVTPAAATTVATASAAATHPQPANHPTKRGCAATVKAGFATCFTIQRTDVPGHKGLFAAAITPSGYGPSQLESAYNLPSSTAGAGETVAVVDAYDDPNAEADLQVYRAQYGLPVCDSANGCFTKVAQDGSTNYPSPDPGWSTEISLDLDMVSAICPNCHILLVEANDASLQNLGTAVNEAVSLGAKYVSNSYGGTEDPSEVTSDSSYYNHPGVAITASSGDSGYGVEYPAASQYVTAVGGTTLTQDSSVPRGWDEAAWAGAGSGCSAYEAKPSWQKDTGCANRTVADVSAEANPNTGVAVYDSYSGGGWGVWGGTSVASPIIASTFALAGTPIAGSYPSSYPYADTSALNDVTSGSNGTCTPAYLCTAGPGYDGPTGLGTPDGVAAFTSGPHGTVSGTVTDASTGKPIADAEVDVGSQPTYTSSAGTYTETVPAGSYAVTAKDFGYQSQTVSGVQVADGQTVMENFALQTVPSVTLTGTVTDGSGHGWPLYAKVSVPGSPASTYTNPATGQYTLTLPVNNSYNVTVAAVSPGYQQAQQSVQVGTSNLTQNFSVPVDGNSCSAPGYKFDYNGNTETFDSSTMPAGWSVVNAPTSTRGWGIGYPGLVNNTGGSGNFAVADSNAPGVSVDTELVSPVVDMSQDTSPYVLFNTDLEGSTGESGTVDVSTDGGQTWTTVWQSLGAPGKWGPDFEAVPLPMAAGKSQVQIRFHYVATFGFWWELDNVFLGNRSCDPTPGGIVEGVVKDGNTGAGVDGATVTSVSTPADTVTTAPTTGDPSIGDGFYYMFVPATGSQQFTAAKTHYTTATGAATVAANSATALNMTMQAGQLSVTPGSVSSTIKMGGSATQNLTFKDTGQAPVTVKLFEQTGGFTMLGQPTGATRVPVQRVSGTFSPLSAAKMTKLAGGAAKPTAQPYDAPWTAIANYPTPIMDNAAATDPVTGLVYSVGGFDSRNTTAAGDVYDPSSKQWTSLPPMQNAREAPQAAFINGKLYVTGGWGSNGIPVATTEIYNPGSGTWSTGASIPNAYAGASVAVLNNKMYVIGGCDASNCGHTDVQVYNPASDSWSAMASYPEPISWAGCGAINGEIYCAGGDKSSTADTSDAFVYDPGTNSWSSIAPVPIDLWGMGYTTANGELLLSGGVTNGFSTITNQGYAYDPSSGSWTALPNANAVVYRGGSACGFYRIGGSPVGRSPAAYDEQLPGYSVCGTVDVPWMSESQTQFTLNPGQQSSVAVTLNAGDASVTQPGAYTAGLVVVDDTPYKTSAVNVAMNVTPPRTWGKITGTVSGLACNGKTGPLAGVTVQLDGSAANYTLKTDANGNYEYWVDASDNPLTVIAALDGWQPQTTGEAIKAGHTISANFTLSPDSC
jgi:N-acetylneuraminic acid mutarotase